MNEETTIITKSETASSSNGSLLNPDSTIGGVSIRAWLATILVLTVCANHLFITVATLIEAVIHRDFAKVGTFTTVGEPLYSMSIAALGFYFGQKVTKP